ncbi:DUF805 domain-containing protein [Bacillus cereus group sp. BfR-BA-01380]|uniref:DUF805 domain-containing protein n=1 Tax=Bacillus cereus group sp. BfR-BA-01380 TaxID=2920324 RepID=UPI001F55CD7C|nr:DUF805 domain-containing protein [Bacillus cereus group sp. BfR-BA-01380]
MQWYVNVLKNYVGFRGRARRKEYWTFTLINYIIFFVFGMLGKTVDILNALVGLYMLAILLPGLAVGARRLHDTGKSGWWQLLCFIPIIGGIVLIVFCCQDSQEGDNKYGSNPKADKSY